MTKDKSHRQLVFSRLGLGYSQLETARICAVSVRSIRRWQRLQINYGSFLPQRRRMRISGVIPEHVQDALMIINSMHPDWYYDELAESLFQITGFAFHQRQIRQCLFRRDFKYNLTNEYRPLEQDLELFRFWREQIIYGGGSITARQLGYLDEVNKKKRDAWRRNAHAPRGLRVVVPRIMVNAGNAASCVVMLSIEGIQSATPVEINVDGNIGK